MLPVSKTQRSESLDLPSYPPWMIILLPIIPETWAALLPGFNPVSETEGSQFAPSVTN